MNKSKQISLVACGPKAKKFFGGALLHGRRKSIRPLSSKDSIHLVLRSTWAKGPDSFLSKRNRWVIDKIICRFAKTFGVRIYQSSINSNHIHLLLRITNRKLYKAFIKAISGQIASQVMQQNSFSQYLYLRKKPDCGYGSKALNSSDVNIGNNEPNGFWQFRPFSRVVSWGRDFKNCVSYLKQNVLEAFGLVQYKPRKNYYEAFIRRVSPDLNST